MPGLRGKDLHMEFLNDQTARRWRRLFILLILVLLLPAALVGLFARPMADDFGYAGITHAVFAEYGFDLPRLLGAALQTTVEYFNNWQGLYVSGFVLALQPGLFGNAWYGLTFFCVVVPLFFCLYFAARLILRRLAPGMPMLALPLALLFLFSFVQGMPNPVEGLYWFNGAVNYQLFFAVAVLNAGFTLALALPGASTPRSRFGLIIGGVLAGLFIGGGHQVVGLLNILILFMALVLCARRRRFLHLPALAAAVLGLVINLTAPGTRVRVGGFSGAGFLEAVVKSFLLAASEWIRWLDVPLLCLLALLAWPLAGLSRTKALNDTAFRHPWLGAAATFVLMWGMIFLPSYSMGGIGAGRLINVVWMVFILGLASTEFLVLGWLQRVKGVSLTGLAHALQKQTRRLPFVAVLLLVCMACIGSHTVKEGQDNHFATSLEACYELASGQAQAFAAALDAREALLLDSSLSDVVIAPLTDEQRPWLLYFADLTPGPESWGLTGYYGKTSVTVSEPQA